MSKDLLPAEQSVAMRVLCCAMTVIAVCAAFVFGESPVPLIEFSSMQLAVVVGCVWLTVGGAIISFHYREQPPPVMKVLVKVGAGLIVLNLARELWLDNMHATQFQFVGPLLHALVSAIVVSSFELRTRSDLNSCAAFSLCLMALAASSGKSILFGACVIVYLILGSVLMYFSARSQSSLDYVPNNAISTYKSRGLSSLPIALAIVLLPLTSVAAFSFIPRLDAEADRLSAHLRASVTSAIYDARRKRQTANEPVSTTVPIPFSKPRRKQSPAPAKPVKEEASTARKEHSSPKNTLQKTRKPPAKSGLPKPSGIKKPPAKSGLPKPPDIKKPPVQSTPPSKAVQNKAASKPDDRPALPRASGSDKPVQPGRSDKLDKSTGSKATTSPSKPKATPSPSAVPGARATTKRSTGVKQAPRSSKPVRGRSPASGASKKKPTEKPAVRKPDQPTNEKNTVSGTGVMPETQQEIQQAMQRSKQGAAVENETFSLDEGMVNPQELLFTLACNRSVYTRITTMDKFDGLTWSQRAEKDSWDFAPSSYGISLQDCPSLEYSMALPVMEIAQTYKIAENLGGHIPTAGIPQYLSLIETVTVDGFGDINTKPPLLKGTSYTVVSQLPIYSLAEMRRALPIPDVNPASLGSYVEVPDSIDNAVFDLSEKLVVGADNRFAQAENICNHLRKNYKYSPVPMKRQESGDLVNTFLFEAKKGDCKAFASGFIMLCRTAGIPARFVGGFVPGDLNSATGTTSVRRKHGHAWAEIFMEPYGWIPFDATPNGMLPARPEEKYYNFKQIKRELEQRTRAMETQAFNRIETALHWVGYVLAGAAGLLALYALGLSSKSLKRGFKAIINALKSRHPASKVKTSVMRDLKKIGMLQGKSDTSADLIKRLSETLENNVVPASSEELERTFRDFLTTYDAVYFGNEEKLAELKRLANDVKRLSRIK